MSGGGDELRRRTILGENPTAPVVHSDDLMPPLERPLHSTPHLASLTPLRPVFSL